MNYYCSQCKLAVIVLQGHEPIKACTCNAAIIAEINAGLKGSGSLNNK